jgi:hypothetical protein
VGGREYQLVTSQGRGASIVFLWKLIELLKSKDEAAKMKNGVPV